MMDVENENEQQDQTDSDRVLKSERSSLRVHRFLFLVALVAQTRTQLK